jgi:HK97 family phage major capsid protein
MNLKEKRRALLAQIAEKNTEQEGLRQKGEALSAEEKARVVALDSEMDALEADVKAVDGEIEIEEKAAKRAEWLKKPNNALEPEAEKAGEHGKKAFVVPAAARRGAKVSAFKSDEYGTADVKAYRFGQFAAASLFKSEKAREFCKEHGIAVKAHSEGSLTAGGYLVPEEFEADLIDLREQYGVFRQHAKMVPMASDTKSRPRCTGGLTPYFVGENTAITESTKSWDRVSLTAKKLAVLTKISSELNEDSVIDLGNDLAQEISYAFAEKEDQCGFNGDGTSTYGGIVGVRAAFLNLSATRANIAGLVVGTGNAYSELTLADFEAVVGRLPQYADTPNARWFCHRSFYWNVMIKLMLASGGVTEAEVSRQGRMVPFLGYPVVFSQIMPSVEANDQVCAVFGDLAKAADFGDRRQTTLATSEHLNFAEDEIAIRGTERFDINVHDVGNADGTAANRVPGPVVALATAAS